ncbi:hypothetical protein AGRA3207_000814 [Actinomadura graeca]|uniref:DUF7668 domain-containing protein n=1 Tax=Actinomadura graeca TaxID=2750812 RepID=A0ABX8QP27_9ACTN|nr:hypothetical protein [Actinomadura graeca]QXJ20156.1 hypothetical protein AGRA3207_000814 [Actinomadura graeca]
MLPEEGVNAVRVVIALLVRGHFEELETLTEGRRLSASAMADAVDRYGGDLISPPEEAFAAVEESAAAEADGERVFAVDFPLWTAQEGRSALAARLALTEVMDGVWTVELIALGAP